MLVLQQIFKFKLITRADKFIIVLVKRCVSIVDNYRPLGLAILQRGGGILEDGLIARAQVPPFAPDGVDFCWHLLVERVLNLFLEVAKLRFEGGFVLVRVRRDKAVDSLVDLHLLLRHGAQTPLSKHVPEHVVFLFVVISLALPEYID